MTFNDITLRVDVWTDANVSSTAEVNINLA